MKKIHVYTSAACNYIPKVRVLIESVRKWHPEWVIHLALSDDPPPGIDLSGEPFDEVHTAASLEIPDFVGWAFCHNIVELSTAIKPFLLKKLLDRDDCAGVIYLDPDTVVFSRLEEVVAALEECNVALTPHQITPETSLSAVMDNEISSLKHGIYNLGFVAVSPTDTGKAFAAWWADRIYYFCRAEIPNGLFTDQRWIDLVPAFFDGVCILRSSRLNVAPWNLTTRELTGLAPNQVLVDQKPLGFYHFTGFDSGAHHTMSQKNATGNATVEKLVAWYLHTTEHLGKDPLSQVKWAYGSFSDGSSIPSAARFVYRERLDLQKTFPDPFLVGQRCFKKWWETQGAVEYPMLFNNATVEDELRRLKGALTPGYLAGKSVGNLSGNLIAAHLKNALIDSAQRKRLVGRSWEILRTEGISGLKNRLKK